MFFVETIIGIAFWTFEKKIFDFRSWIGGIRICQIQGQINNFSFIDFQKNGVPKSLICRKTRFSEKFDSSKLLISL